MNLVEELRAANTALTHRAANTLEVLLRSDRRSFSFAPFVAACAIAMLVAQTVLFGIAYRSCQFGLDFKSQFGHNAPIINNSGLFNVSHHCNASPDDGRGQC